jgi:hypothetical protein
MITARQRPDFEALNLRKQRTFLALLLLEKYETPVLSQHDSAANSR